MCGFFVLKPCVLTVAKSHRNPVIASLALQGRELDWERGLLSPREPTQVGVEGDGGQWPRPQSKLHTLLSLCPPLLS